MISVLGLGGAVFFDGWQADINSWLADKHYIVSTSVIESQGMGILEGMACGLKPVVHNFPGAQRIFSPQFVFNTPRDFCTQILSTEYEPRRYREFVMARYSLSDQLGRVNSLLMDLGVRQLKAHLTADCSKSIQMAH
jgi:glycosyltransferase involved in cell wall biosynthesis